MKYKAHILTRSDGHVSLCSECPDYTDALLSFSDQGKDLVISTCSECIRKNFINIPKAEKVPHVLQRNEEGVNNLIEALQKWQEKSKAKP